MSMVRPQPQPMLLHQVPVRVDRTTVDGIFWKSNGKPAAITDDAYPLRDARIHHLVLKIEFKNRTTSYLGFVPLLRVPGVLVPVAAADGLGPQPDYVRLGLPAYVRGLFRKGDVGRRGLGDPLYSSTDDVWWVRAWPTDVLATAVAADGTVTTHDAAALLKTTGRGFTVTADLVFDFFYTRKGASPNALSAAAATTAAGDSVSGPVVTVLRSVVTGLHDPRPEPVPRPGIADTSPGCHLPTRWNTPASTPLPVSPDAVLVQLAALGRVWGRDDDDDPGAPTEPLPAYHVGLGSEGA